MTEKKRLDELTDDLQRLIGNEDLTDEDLRDASEGLLPSLCDALSACGFGVRYFKIWSNEHKGWWKPNKQGYTEDRREAGIYPEDEALEIVEGANIGLHNVPNEALVELVADEPYKIA